ncbi:reverse transcriptase zinc-binding domain-containing protein [Tanacetum coccineum]
MHIYWASMFILPSRVLLDIEQIIRHFLWSHGSSKRCQSKVAWEVVCLPKDEGGLGVRRLDTFNKALMVSHMWKLLSLKESLWVRWVHIYKLNNRNFWDVLIRGNISWGWRKVLQLRPLIRPFIWSSIGDGVTTSLWFDNWSSLGPLADFIPSRDRYTAGLTASSTVSDVFHNGVWNWPNYLVSKYDQLLSMQYDISNDNNDRLLWRNEAGQVCDFSVSMVWSTIRHRNEKVDWVNAVWFPYCIPKHAFNLWLVVKQRLKTQDKIASWEVSDSLMKVCSLCEQIQDSHDHLFFECTYSKQVWNHFKRLAGMCSLNECFNQILVHIIPFSKRRSPKSVIAKLVLAATTYYIWQERNWRMFKGKKRSVQQVCDCIFMNVRLKLLSCRFKRSRGGPWASRWNLPDSCFV